jgi:sucrose-6F-phosphate phosphohydrolase
MVMKYLLVCDLDDTLTGNKKAVIDFNRAIDSKKFCLVYSSGRYKSSMTSLIVRVGLVFPEVIIANVGTEIYYAPNWDVDKQWEQKMGKEWNEQRIVSVLDSFGLQRQPYEKQFVVPYYADDKSVVKQVKRQMKLCNAKVVHTRNQFLDIIPESAGKGNAAKYLGRTMDLPIVCCGDSENDEEMLRMSDYGILVGNAPDHLKAEISKFDHIYVAESCNAKGVLEGLRHYKIIS